ncbi:RnfABCDGE type electron transport complex subunit D [Kaarinaea lacus]
MLKTLIIKSSPHIATGLSVEIIMRNVVFALLPAAFYSIYVFGLNALLVLLTATLSCVITERVLCKLFDTPNSINDWSATITGLIYGMTLPPGLPLWMVIIGGVIGISVGKFLFGGLGFNVFNPALVGRAFLQAAFPAAMTHWIPAFAPERFESITSSTLAIPFAKPVYDAISTATPLAAMKFDSQLTDNVDLFMGTTSGSTGETGALLLLLGGAYLIARNMMNWRIPAGIFLAVILISAIFYNIDSTRYAPPLFMLFSGGLMLGALFMATDMVASPMTHMGCFIYGILIGVLIVIIRYWGGLPEGVMYAILIANALSPHIDRLVQPIPFGTRDNGVKNSKESL